MSVSRYFVLRWQRRLAVFMPVVLAAGITSAVVYATSDDEPTTVSAADSTPRVDTGSGRPTADPAHDRAGSSNAVAGGQRGRDSATGGMRPSASAATAASTATAGKPATRRAVTCRTVGVAARPLGDDSGKVCSGPALPATNKPGSAPVLSVARGESYEPGTRRRVQPAPSTSAAPKPSPTKTTPRTPPTATKTTSPVGAPSPTKTQSPTRSSAPKTTPTRPTAPVSSSAARSPRATNSIKLAAATGPLHTAPVPGSAPGRFQSPNWVSVGGGSGAPYGTYGGTTAYDPVRNRVVFFGGCLATATNTCYEQGTTYLLGDGGWTTVTGLTTSPPNRAHAVMAWDPGRQRVILFGGVDTSNKQLNDTWAWDGSAWTRLYATATAPSSRSHAAMAYSPERKGLVLFGGQKSLTEVTDNDTWVLGASGWVKVLASGAAGAPAFRTNPAMAYMGASSGGQLVLFGGAACAASGCTTPAVVNDTWVLPASGSWVKQSPTQSPEPLQMAAFAYDRQLDANILFGGRNVNGSTNKTWAWTGSNWLQAQTGVGSPETRYYAHIAPTKSGALSVFGGVVPLRDPTLPMDRWSYDAKTPILGISVSPPAENATTYLAGQVVTVKVTAQNTGIDNLTSGDATSITAGLNNGSKEILSAVGSAVTFAADPNDPVPGCRSLPAGSTTSAALAGLIPTVSRAAINGGCTATASFLAVVVGSPHGCALQTISAQAGSISETSTDSRTTLTICGNGLGREDWWTYDSTDLGAGASANVNVANGNLLVKQDDSTVIGSRGDLAFGLSRAYNSQDVLTGNAGQGGVLGTGWQFQIGETGAAANGVSLGSLIVPTLNSVLDPLAVTYVDRDGTRFVFRPKTPSLDDISGSLLKSAKSLTKTGLENLLNLKDNTLGQNLKSIVDSLGGSGPLVCVDTTYTPPPGADMYLYRYLAFGSGSGASGCSSADPSKGVNVGYSLVRPDRIRYDFNLLGQLSDTVDGAGNTLFYTYDAANRPSRIYGGSCVPNGANLPKPEGAVTGDACRQYSFVYSTPSPSGNRIDVTDAARRVTTYIVEPVNLSSGAPSSLTQVWNPDNPYSATGTPSIRYTYSATNAACPGSDATASTPGQLCSATDPLGAKTAFAYTKAAVGPDRVLSVTDRRANSTEANGGGGGGNMVRYTYGDGMTTADSGTPNTFGTGGTGCDNNAACERIRYGLINSVGSVGEVVQGDATGSLLKKQAFFWDSDTNATPCRQPDAIVDYNLCQTIVRAAPTTSPIVIDKPTTGTVNGVTVADHATRFVYGDLGQVLVTDKIIDPSKAWTASNSAITTAGARSQYVEAGDEIRAFDDTPRGTGAVDSATTGSSTSYGDSVKADKPSAFYRFAEPAGTNTLVDSAGRNQSATYGANVPRGLPAGVPGDTAVGDPGAVAVATSQSTADFAMGTGDDSAFTVEAWQQTPRPDTSYTVCTPCTGAGLIVGRFNGAPSVNLIGGSGGIRVTANASIADGRWHQVDYAYDGSGKAAGVSIYVDGDRVATTTGQDNLSGPFRGGGEGTQLGYNVNGVNGDGVNLSNVALFHSELSAKRIGAHYNAVRNTSRADATTLYAVTDQTASLTPRGNDPANASRWGDFVTTYERDLPDIDPDTSTSAPTPNQRLDGDVCKSTTTNTGLLCATVSPASAGVDKGDCPSVSVGAVGNPPGTAPHTCTTSTYDTFGQMRTKRSAKAHASGANDAMVFTYYEDTGTCSTAAGRKDCDLSGTVSAGGWLKAVTDQNGKSVVTAPDAAGNPARTWDRNAVAGLSLDNPNWTNASSPPSTEFDDKLMANPVTSASISASMDDIEIVRGDGTVWGSGANSQNELGDNPSAGGGTATSTPVQAAGLDGVVQVVQNGLAGSSGTYFSTARTTTGAVYTWGNNKPVTAVGGLPPIISLAAGGGHTLALDNTGTVWAWGDNESGQLGNNTTGGPVSTPVKITTGVSAIAAGKKSSYAVKTDGSVYAWGLNGAGQLATGDRTIKTGPTKSDGLSKIVAVYGGVATAYAIGADGSVWSWGDNNSGALGTGTASSSVTAPAKITTLGPASAAGPVRQIAGSIWGAAALMSDGSVRAWGSNSSGQLGSGTANSSTPVVVPGVSGQVALSGSANTYVSADVGGKLTIWGKTSSGQKGDGTSPATSAPSATSADHNVSPFVSPWRYERGGRDPVGNLTTVVANPNGNVLQSTPARGTAMVTSAYDTTATYNASDKPIALLTPQQRDGRDANGALTGVIAATTMAYDTFGNAVTMTDPRGYAVVTKFDSVNRKTETLSTRADEAQTISKCDGGSAVAAAGSFTAKQSGHIVCRTSWTYDGNNHGITATDALKFTTRTTFDGLGRATASTKPRSGTQTLTTATNYDRDGNKLDVCPPRQTGGCTSTGVFSTHTAYDPAGRAITSTKYRDSVAKSLVTSMAYDADGNAIGMTDPAGRTTTTTYDLLGRKVAQSRPRGNGVRNTTRWNYDASGNVLAVLAPGAAYPGTGADGALTVDGANNPKANPFRVPDNAQYTTVTLKNGGWVTGQNGGLVFTATGSVTVCGSCGITEAGDGQAGGAGGAAGAGAVGNGTAGNTAVSGGKAGNGSGTNAGGGGGGGHKTAGEAGRGGAAAGGAGGAAYGRADFSDIASNYFDAAGGGGGGGGKSGLNPNAAGTGGKGGGFVRITADTISIDGTVDASGNAGANSNSSSGGGGGGAGGSIWLAGGDVKTGSSAKLDVSGGAGGTTSNMPNGAGGAGARGFLRIDADGDMPSNSGADAEGHLANITAYSYDANNRVLDTVLGAQTTDATSVTNAAPDEDGLSNTRSRSVYDPDGNVVASLPPQAFSASGGSLMTNTDTAARRDYDLDGNLTTSYDPRYDSSGAADTGAGNDGGQNINQQKSQCPTGATPSLAPGLKAYGSQIGVCVTTVLYDANGNQAKQSLATSNGSDNRYLMRTYSDDGLVQSETSPDPTQPTGSGRVTTGFLYDGVGRLTKTTDPSGAASTTAYFADGLTSEEVDQCYNTADKPTDAPKAECTASGVNITHRTVMTYDADGHLTTQLQPRAQTPTQASTSGLTAADFTTTTTWTSDGLKASIEAPGLGKGDFNKTTYGYDDVGNQVDVGMPSANASTPDASNPGKAHAKYQFTDDNLIRVSSTPVTASTYRNVVYRYNPAGQKVSTDICTTAERDSCPGYAKNDDGTIKSPDGRGLTTYTYAPNGLNVLQVAKAHTTTPTTIRTSYDYAGRVKSIKDSSGGGSTVTAGYYLDGLLRTADDGRNANTYAYDGDSHVTNRTDKTSSGGVTGGAVKRTSYSYGDSGLMRYMTSDVHANAKTSVEYDKSGRMTKWSVGGDGKTGEERNYVYFADDRLRSVATKTSDEAPDKSRLDFAYSYDNDGNIISQTATGTASSNYTNTYDYNPAANITSYKHVKDGTGTTPTTTTTYAWDHNANRLSAAETKGSTTTTQKWKYRVDNSISTQTIDQTGATSATQDYRYDQAGLLRSVAITPSGGSSTTCTTSDYDDLDRLKKTTTDGSDVCGGKSSSVAYTYDGVDRQRTQTTTKASSTTETVTIYDGLSKTTTGQSKAGAEDGSKPDNLYQLTPDGKHVAVWEAKASGPATSLMVDDDNGNTSLLINTTKTGAASTGCTVDYDPFGNPSAPTAATTKPEGACSGGTDAKTTGNAAWYRDERRDATTGDYQLGSRTYDPSNGNFTTPDQYRVSDSDTDLGVGTDPLTANTYSYVNGNPLNVSDPSGHCPDSSVCPGLIEKQNRDRIKRGGYKPTRSGPPSNDGGWVNEFVNDVARKPPNRTAAKPGKPGGAALPTLIDYPGKVPSDIPKGYVVAPGDPHPYNLPYKPPPPPAPEELDCGAVQWLCDFTGATDAYKCGQDLGVNAACAETVLALLPVIGKAKPLLKIGRVAEDGSDAARVGRAGDDAAGAGRSGTAAKSCVPGNSFTAETPVTLADGSTKPIRDVKVGDKVLATDPETGETAAEPVEQLIRHGGPHAMVLISLADGSVLDSTDGHPIWDATTGRFTEASKLHVGNKIRTRDGDLITIASLTEYTADLTAYNLQVSTIHTYYAGTTSVLVHNSNPCRLSPAARRQLGNLADQSNSKAADVIRARGGGASQVNQLQSGFGELTLGELAARAAARDPEAVKALKMIKQAGSQGKGGK